MNNNYNSIFTYKKQSESFSSILSRAYLLLDIVVINKNSRVLIHTDNFHDFFVNVFAALIAGAIPVIDGNKTQSSSSYDVILTTEASKIVSSEESDFNFIFEQFLENEIHFITSGTTGAPKVFKKKIKNLISEVLVLIKTLGIGSRSTFVSLISPFHIYGFLHSFLVPIYSNSSVLYLDILDSDNIEHMDTSYNFLLTVPSAWKVTKDLLSKVNVKSLITSGGAFGGIAQEELLSNPFCLAYAFDILGSTETGGIGVRDILKKSETFTLFEGVNLSFSKEDNTLVESDFIYGDELYEIADRIVVTGDSSFRHEGRQDRVFKFLNKRYSLEAIESNMNELVDCSDSCCMFNEDIDHAKGGELIAFFETSRRYNYSKLREDYLKKFSPPFPSKIFYYDKFPLDINGKRTAHGLLSGIDSL